MRLVIFFLTLFFLPIAMADPSARIMIPLQISGHVLSAEVSHTITTREQGLMHRNTLEENSGMLFVFPKTDRYSMWMLNTHIPLSVAFLDEEGTILNISVMTPHTKIPHYSAGMAKYALEMNQGWFSAKKIKAGERVVGLEQAPVAQ